MEGWFSWMLPVLVLAAGGTAGYVLRVLLDRAETETGRRVADETIGRAKAEAEAMHREAEVRARDEVVRARESFEHENADRRRHLTLAEERLAVQEAGLEKRVAMLEKKESALEAGLAAAQREQEAAAGRRADLDRVVADAQAKLQEVAALPRDEARRILMQRLEEELRAEQGAAIRRAQEEARRTAEQQARDIITSAIERYAADQVGEITTCTITLPNEEMKGRIIGREGRNIRSLETETGCNILIDDTPETVVISGFDPMRREIARRVLERLIADGRIHPARIEEEIAKVREEVDQIVREAGEAAVCELGLTGVAPELVRTVGQLKFRTSYAQNVLRHSIEMAHLMGMMASDLGLDPAVARRIGLFHDIGKALDHTVEGPHAEIGAALLKRYGETPLVINAVAAHHRETQADSPYASLATAADALTAARPGARAETTELYLKRLSQIEGVAKGFDGVKTSYAIQAGRELRVFVLPDRVDDNEAMRMARAISKKIEEQVRYPGQIKVTVIRETRCVEFAH